MKLIVLLALTLPGMSGGLIRWGQSMLAFLSLDVQVVFVLAIFPITMNVFQFCVMDQVIKAGKGAEAKERGDGEDDDDEEMDGYEPVPTRERDDVLGSPRRLPSGAAMSRTSSRASSVASLAVTEEQRLLDGGRSENVWSALSRRAGSASGDEGQAGIARRSSRVSLKATDDDFVVGEPDAVPLSPLSPRISRT